jgi:hypothetical protein
MGNLFASSSKDTKLEAIIEYDSEGEAITDNFSKLKRIIRKNIGHYANIHS